MANIPCYLCGIQAYTEPSSMDGELISCRRCGKYLISRSLSMATDDFKKAKDKLYKVSSWVWEQNNLFNQVPTIDSNNFPKLLEIRDKKVKEKFDLMMQCQRRS